MTIRAVRRLTSVRIEAEVAKKQKFEFEEKYRQATGDNPPAQHLKEVEDSNKWGVEMRLYFNCDDSLLKRIEETYTVEKKRNHYLSAEYAYRINNNELIWELLRLGYCLGVRN